MRTRKNCRCACHSNSAIKHVMPCCYSDDDDGLGIGDFMKDQFKVPRDGEDPRKTALKEGLRQLRPHEVWRLIEWVEGGGPVLLDRDEDGNANYNGQAYCPLAIAVRMHEGVPYDSDESVFKILTGWFGLKVYNTRGVKGEFYTTERRRDLLIAAREVMLEKSSR